MAGSRLLTWDLSRLLLGNGVRQMASSFVAAGKESHRHHFLHHHHVSPKNSSKKTTGFANAPPPGTPSCGDGHHHPGGAMPKCVCAPATHAGSFKCRLHRVNSHGHSAPSAPAPHAPSSSTRTVEAQ